MQGSENFENTIQAYLNSRAQEDALFAESLKKPNKNIKDCVQYIFKEVQKSGCNGFADEEVYNMAVHYYDEDKLDIGKPLNCKVVVNHGLPPTKQATSNPIRAIAKPNKKEQQLILSRQQTSLF